MITESKLTKNTSKYDGTGPRITVLTDRCAGCQECVIRCPTEALTINVETWVAEGDDSLCVGCRQCVRTCPFSAITIDGPVLANDRTEFTKAHPEPLIGNFSEVRLGFSSVSQAQKEALRCLICPDPTCVRGCPAHNDIPGFISAIRNGDLDGARQILLRTSALPDICSRVCDQALQCEGACSYALAGDEPVAIGALERFVFDNTVGPRLTNPRNGNSTKHRVAIVGSGPAAIGASYVLVQNNVQVDVFEKDEEPGGLLSWGIPDFTLPNEIKQKPWRDLLNSGVKLYTNQPVHPEEIEKLAEQYDAVILAYGASSPIRLPIEGAEGLDGITDATTFLKLAKKHVSKGLAPDTFFTNFGLPSGSHPHVLVLGGGNTAMDVARTAIRFGAGATCVEWMDRKFAPVRKDELEEALSEGVRVLFSTTVTRLEGQNGRVNKAKLSRTEQKSASQLPKIVEPAGEERIDLIVMALGYRIDMQMQALNPSLPIKRAAEGLPDRRWQASGIISEHASRAWSRGQSVGILSLGRETALIRASLPVKPKVWVVGDALVGPSTVVEAMAQGREAAYAILDSFSKSTNNKTLPKKILICYESMGGNTKRVAEDLAKWLDSKERQVVVSPIRNVTLEQIAWAELIIVGTWVEGFIVAKVGPAKKTKRWLESLPTLLGKDVAVYCTYAVNPGSTLDQMSEIISTKGGKVCNRIAFKESQVKVAGMLFASELEKAYCG